MKGWLAENEIQQAGVVGLNDEKEYLLGWNAEEGGTDDGIGWVGPYSGVN